MKQKNIVLIGMMGCGKSTIGALLARRLGRKLVDTDALVEAQEGRTIPEIFASDGEEYFRQAEERVAKALASRSALVIACGGGLPLREESIRPLKESGTVFFLCRDPGEIYDTVSMAGRPLGQGGREAFLARFAQREPVYRRWADHVIQRFETPDQTVRAILEVL
ncbi:MAG TPA: shikimate kinase [Candidatus Flavonifractor merdipullorum]|uniref:Shikimate kinase n=1 Tax=Candidatus Flavonifractor merdipullorum TaxID=2838590 RepID=A0A9D1UPY6_9FIRM|nr:shikimate kinase [Candidatus Flavonifractor merdipullorum]